MEKDDARQSFLWCRESSQLPIEMHNTDRNHMKAIMLIPELLFSSGYFENLSIELKKKKKRKQNQNKQKPQNKQTKG